MTASIKIEDSHLDDQKAMSVTDKIETLEFDEDTRRIEKRLVRKLDMTLMPVVWILYFFNCKADCCHTNGHC
jgi:hypothetical protein